MRFQHVFKLALSFGVCGFGACQHNVTIEEAYRSRPVKVGHEKWTVRPLPDSPFGQEYTRPGDTTKVTLNIYTPSPRNPSDKQEISSLLKGLHRYADSAITARKLTNLDTVLGTIPVYRLEHMYPSYLSLLRSRKGLIYLGFEFSRREFDPEVAREFVARLAAAHILSGPAN